MKLFRDCWLLIFGAIMVVFLLGYMALVTRDIITERQTAASRPHTNLDLIRSQEFPGYGRVSLFKHTDGTCVLIAKEGIFVGVSRSWCE